MDGMMSLGLTAEVEYIPIDASKVPYTFSVKLGDRRCPPCGGEN